MRAPAPPTATQTYAVLLCAVALVGCGPQSVAEQPSGRRCEQTVAAFDIGSATTKLQVARINTCTHRIVERLARTAQRVPYGVDVAQSGRIQDSTLNEGVEVLQNMTQLAFRHHPDASIAVATEAMRQAENADEVVARMRTDTGLDVSVITQDKEAKLAFWGALMVRPEEPSRAVVWDIGGESMQLTGLLDEEVKIHGIDFGTNDMHRFMAEQVQRRPVGASPNPATSTDANAARRHAREHTLSSLPLWLKLRLATKDPLIIGVGAIRHYADPDSQRSWCTGHGLGQALSGSLERTDADIGGDYAAERVPALALIMGGMDALGVERLEVADVDLTDGLLATHAP